MYNVKFYELHTNRIDLYPNLKSLLYLKLLQLDAIRGKIVQFLAKHVFDKNMCGSKCFECVAHVIINI